LSGLKHQVETLFGRAGGQRQQVRQGAESAADFLVVVRSDGAPLSMAGAITGSCWEFSKGCLQFVTFSISSS